MPGLRVVQAKPNPAGKDRLGSYAPPQQVAAEWVDIKNAGGQAVGLQGIKLYHRAYTASAPQGEWAPVTDLSGAGTLLAGQILRVHSGGPIPVASLRPEDAAGAHWHYFTGRNYVWNNAHPDQPGLWNGSAWIDLTSYAARPPEGAILVRVGNELVVSHLRRFA